MITQERLALPLACTRACACQCMGKPCISRDLSDRLACLLPLCWSAASCFEHTALLYVWTQLPASPGHWPHVRSSGSQGNLARLYSQSPLASVLLHITTATAVCVTRKVSACFRIVAC